MSKQVPAGQPGMYPNSGGIPTASQQHHQPVIGASAPSPQPSPMVQPDQQINSGHNMSMNNYYARTSAPRTMPSMARNPLTNVVNQTAQQPSSQYSQPVHMVPSHASFNQMPAVLLNHHLAHMYQQRPYSPPQYSIISPGPAAVYVNSWNNYSNPTPPNTNGYYPSTPISSFNTIPPPPVSNHMPAPTTQLRKNAIPVINPDTGEDLLNRLNDDDSSRPQLEKEAENVGTNISIQFAAQVAAALANDQKNESLPKSAPVEDRRILDSQPPVLCPSEIEPHPAVNRRSQPGRGEKPKKIISFSSSLTQNIKLHESENAWKPSHKVEKPADETAEIQDLYRKVRGILNKLTPQKFETLVGQVKTLSINTEEKLKLVIDLVFAKATDEPNFSVPYANMCKQLALIKVPLAGRPGQQVNFRKLLLTKCQKEFQQDRTDELKRKDRIKAIESADPEKKKELQLEYDEEEKKMRYRQLGNIRFIGELFKLNMLIEPIMHECIKKLISQQDEESLECLCRLLKTIGKELDEGKSKKAPRDTNLTDGYFAEMQRIVDKRLTGFRVRFMLQDVIDLKKNNWIPRRDENNPKTIDQIHKEAEREAREQQQVFSNMNYSKRMPDDRDRRKSAARNLGQSEEGWIPSSKSNKGSYNVVDPNKLKLTKPDEVESIRLGPGGRGLPSWGRGSSGGTKTSGDSDAKTPLANRYSALSDQSLAPNYEARRGAQRSAALSRESSRGRNNPMTPPVRKTPSTSKERENLLETVKGLASRTGVSEPKAQDIKRNPESLLNGKAVDGPAVALRGVELSEDDVEKKTKPLINECLHNSDSEEATKCVTELASPTTDHYFIKSAVNQFLERSSQSRYFLGQLLCSLKKENIRISLEDYKKGFCGILENLDGYALDIAFIWEYIGEILVPMIEDNKLPLTFLKDILEPCMPSQKAGKLVSAVLHCAAKKKGTIKLGELWRECGLQWTDFLGSSANVDDFIRTYKLEFTIRPTKILPDTEMSSEGIKNLKILLEKTEESEEIFDRKNANVSRNALTKPSFIRALATAAHEDAITDYQKRSKGKKIPPSVKVNLSKQVIEKKTEPILDEFLYNGNFEEATKSVKELNSPSTIHYFISSAINQVLERSSQSRHLLGQLLCCLKRKNVITLHQYKKGFKYILENMDEYALDIPLVWKYVGEIVEPMIEDTKNPIIFLKYVLEPCMPSYAAGKIVSAILHIAAMEKGVIKMGKLWMESGMKWTDFLGFDVDVTSFIRTYKLEFTINPTEVLANTKVPQEDTRKNLPERTVESEDIFGSEDIAVLQDTQIKSPSIPTLDTAIHKSALTGVQSEDLKPCAVHLISSSVSRSQLPAEEILSSTKVITMTCTSDPYDQCTPGMEQKLNYGNESSLLSVVPADSLVDEPQNNVETDVTKSASFGHTISSPVLPSQILTEKSSIQLDQSNSEGKQKQKEEIKSSLLSIDPVASIVDQPQNNVETDVTESTSFGLTVSSPVLPSQTPIGKTSGLGQSNSERKQRQKDEIKSSLLSVVSTDSVVMKVLDAAKVDLEECAVIQSCVADIVSAVVKLSQLPAEETLSSTKVITMTCTSDPYDQCTPGMEHKLNYGNESSLLSVVPADSLVDEPQNNVETDVTKSASFGHTVPSPVLPSQIPTEKSSIRLDQSNSEGKQKQKEEIKSSLLSIDPVASIVDKPQNNVETDVTESTSFGHTVSSPVLPSQTPIEKTSGLGQSNSERKQRQKDEIKSCLLSVVSTDSVVMKVLDADKVDLEECAVIQSCVADIVSAVVKLSLFPAEENRSNIETNTLQCISTSHNQSMPEEKQRPKDKIESSLLSIIPVNSVISDSHNSSPTKSTKPVGEQPCVTQTAFSQMPFLQSPAEEISSDIENNFRLCAPLVEKQKPKSICFYYSRDTIISHPHNSTETNLKVSTVVQPCVAHIMSVPPSQPSPGKIPSCIENDIMSCPAFRMPSSAPGMKKQKEGIESSFSEIPVDSVINKAHNSTEKGVVESAVVQSCVASTISSPLSLSQLSSREMPFSTENNIVSDTSVPHHKSTLAQEQKQKDGDGTSLMTINPKTDNCLKNQENVSFVEDSDKLFLLSLLTEFKQIPQEKKLKTKIQILQILADNKG